MNKNLQTYRLGDWREAANLLNRCLESLKLQNKSIERFNDLKELILINSLATRAQIAADDKLYWRLSSPGNQIDTKVEISSSYEYDFNRKLLNVHSFNGGEVNKAEEYPAISTEDLSVDQINELILVRRYQVNETTLSCVVFKEAVRIFKHSSKNEVEIQTFAIWLLSADSKVQ